MDPAAMRPFGMALLDFWKGDKSVYISIIRDDGFQEEVAMSTFFRGPEQFTGLEKTALDRCRGVLMGLGQDTTAWLFSPEAIAFALSMCLWKQSNSCAKQV